MITVKDNITRIHHRPQHGFIHGTTPTSGFSRRFLLNVLPFELIVALLVSFLRFPKLSLFYIVFPALIPTSSNLFCYFILSIALLRGTHSYTYTHAYTFTYTHAHSYIYFHVYIHILTHMHISFRLVRLPSSLGIDPCSPL